MAVLFLEEEELLYAAVDVGAGVVPLGLLEDGLGCCGTGGVVGLRNLLGNVYRCRTRCRLGSYHIYIRTFLCCKHVRI